MFIPFLAAISAATAFTQLGAMAVKIAIALAAYALWIKAT